MTACEPGDGDPQKVIAAEFRGQSASSRIAVAILDENNFVTITVGGTKISWTGEKTGSLTGVYTEGGGAYTGNGGGKWAYLYKDEAKKIGFIYKNSTNSIYIFTGKFSKDQNTIETLEEAFGITLDLSGVNDDYPSIYSN